MFERVDNTKKSPANVNRTSPYEGQQVVQVQSGNTIRIFPAAMLALGLIAGSRVAIGKMGEKDGQPIFGIAKTQHQDNTDGTPNDGRKIDENGKLSSAASSDLLGEGNVYKLGAPVSEGGMTVFPMEFVEKVKLPKRKAKVTVATDTATVAVTTEAVADIDGGADTPAQDAEQAAPAQSESDAINMTASASQVEEEDEY